MLQTGFPKQLHGTVIRDPGSSRRKQRKYLRQERCRGGGGKSGDNFHSPIGFFLGVRGWGESEDFGK